MNLPYKLKFKKKRKENRLQVLASLLESYYVLLFFSVFNLLFLSTLAGLWSFQAEHTARMKL